MQHVVAWLIHAALDCRPARVRSLGLRTKNLPAVTDGQACAFLAALDALQPDSAGPDGATRAMISQLLSAQAGPDSQFWFAVLTALRMQQVIDSACETLTSAGNAPHQDRAAVAARRRGL